MIAKDVMTTNVVTVEMQTTVSDIAKLLLERNISAVPVVDPQGKIAGIVSEGDLMRRPETDTDTRKRSWWLSLMADRDALAGEYSKSHGRRASDVMTGKVLVVEEETPLSEIAQTLEEKHIKRVPVLRDGELVGIVSRADLLRGLATCKAEQSAQVSESDQTIQENLRQSLRKAPWLSPTYVNATVSDGIVHLWGMVESEAQDKAVRIAAEAIPGVKAVEDHLRKSPPMLYWSE